MPAADYPASAIRDRMEGTVLVQLTIPPDGIPKDVKVVRGLRADFDESAIAAVNKWKFRPAMKDGNPIQVTVTLQVEFKAPLGFGNRRLP